MDELRQKMIDSANDEIEDIYKYMNLSEKSTGCTSGVLKDIAHDEYTHAKHLIELLKGNGGIPDDTMQKWEKCKNEYGNI